MSKPAEPAPQEKVDGNPEHPEKTDVELELAELDKVSGGTGFRAAPTAASSDAVGIHQIVPITPEGEAEQAPDAAGVFQIEAI
jgi:hypothetical protein